MPRSARGEADPDGLMLARAAARRRNSTLTVDTVQMSCAHRGDFEGDNTATLEDAVEDGLGKIWVVQGNAPVIGGLIDGEKHGATADTAERT